VGVGHDRGDDQSRQHEPWEVPRFRTLGGVYRRRGPSPRTDTGRGGCEFNDRAAVAVSDRLSCRSGRRFRLCLAGTALGLVGAFFLARFLRSLLFGISTSDGPTILVVIVTMTAVVVAATYLPAMRASRIDPMLALRQE